MLGGSGSEGCSADLSLQLAWPGEASTVPRISAAVTLRPLQVRAHPADTGGSSTASRLPVFSTGVQLLLLQVHLQADRLGLLSQVLAGVSSISAGTDEPQSSTVQAPAQPGEAADAEILATCQLLHRCCRQQATLSRELRGAAHLQAQAASC